jgi:uncharacterized lipoprotein YmbA
VNKALTMLKFLLASSFALLAAGCAGTSPPTHFYALDATRPAAAVASMPELSLGLGPIVLPDTLDRPQIVTQDAPYRRQLAEFDRWTGELRTQMGRLLAQRLMQGLGTDRVFLHPWPAFRRLNYQVRVDVLSMHGRLADKAVLRGNWTLLEEDGRRELYLQAFDLEQPLAGPAYVDMVAALSELATRLGDDIANGIAQRGIDGL